MKTISNFSDFSLTRNEMKNVLGGDCPTAGTRKFYQDSTGAGIFTYGFNAIGAKGCKGTIKYTCTGNCGWA